MDILTVTLNPCVDQTQWVRAFDSPEIRCDWQSGGKGINIARVLFNLGVPCEAIAPAGGAMGERFSDLARAEGIPLRTVPIGGETRLVQTIARETDYAQQVRWGAPPSMTEAECQALFQCVLQRLEEARVLVIGGSACCERAAQMVPAMIHEAKRRGVRTVLDSNGLALMEGAKAGPDVIKPNSQELNQLAGRDLLPGEEDAAAQALIAGGIIAVLTSLGDRGAMYAVEGQTLYCPAAPVDLVNAVGSGDCFLAGWLYAQWMGYTDQMALALANCAGAANARVFPAARIQKADIEALLGYAI